MPRGPFISVSPARGLRGLSEVGWVEDHLAGVGLLRGGWEVWGTELPGGPSGLARHRAG